MKFLCQALFTVGCALSLNATTIFYNTTGAITGGTAGSTSDFLNFTDGSGDSATITFNYDTGDSASSTGSPTNAQFGNFVVSDVVGTISIPTTTFVLTINQTSPGTEGSTNSSPVTVDGELTAGTISGTTNTVDVIFSPATVNVTDTVTPGTATYDLFETPLDPPSTGGGVTTQSGTITYVVTQASSTPEPATLALMGAGLLGVGLISRKRGSRQN